MARSGEDGVKLTLGWVKVGIGGCLVIWGQFGCSSEGIRWCGGVNSD